MMEIKCGVCGEITEFENPLDFSKLQDADLGGLPKFTGEDSFEKMVQCCPVCGYCNFDISNNVLTANKLLQSEEYQYIISSEDLDKSISSMMAVAYIYECQNSYYISAKAHSFTSKMLEDKGESERALIFKEQEVRLLLLHISTEYFKKHFDIKIYQYLIDALRRLKKFDKAIQFCDIALTKTYASVQRNIFFLEKSLCLNYISDSHEFGEKNGEFNNFYQILIQGFSLKQNENTYKDMFDKSRAYLEKSVYFPIADGADFIIKIDKTESVSMDKMITELRKTYDSVLGLKDDLGNDFTAVDTAKESTDKPKEDSVKIMTMQELEEEKSALVKFESLKVQFDILQNENSEILKQLVAVTNEKEALTGEVNVLYSQCEKEQEKLQTANGEIEAKNAEISNLQETTTSLEDEKTKINQELQETIKSRRELTADFDQNIYNLELENQQLKNRINELCENSACQPEIEQQEEIIEENNEDYQPQEEFESDATNQENNESLESESTFEESAEETEETEEEVSEAEFGSEEPIFQDDQINNDNYEEDDMAVFVLDEITEEMILSIAKIGGQIDVSEVQGMLLIGYKDAKFALEKIAGDGKLQEVDEDIYQYIEV